MTERKEPYYPLTPPLVASVKPAAPAPDAVLAVLERVREMCDEELARVERHGGCCGFAERVRAAVGKVLL